MNFLRTPERSHQEISASQEESVKANSDDDEEIKVMRSESKFIN
jgi:hypothetical protein